MNVVSSLRNLTTREVAEMAYLWFENDGRSIWCDCIVVKLAFLRFSDARLSDDFCLVSWCE